MIIQPVSSVAKFNIDEAGRDSCNEVGGDWNTQLLIQWNTPFSVTVRDFSGVSFTRGMRRDLEEYFRSRSVTRLTYVRCRNGVWDEKVLYGDPG